MDFYSHQEEVSVKEKQCTCNAIFATTKESLGNSAMLTSSKTMKATLATKSEGALPLDMRSGNVISKTTTKLPVALLNQ